MTGHWEGEPYPCPNHVPPRKCQEVSAGQFVWHDASCRLWQDVNEQGDPVGTPYEKFYEWVPTEESCEP